MQKTDLAVVIPSNKEHEHMVQSCLNKNQLRFIKVFCTSAIWYNNVAHRDLQVYRSVVLNWPRYDIDESCFNVLQPEYGLSKDKPKYENTFAFYAEVV